MKTFLIPLLFLLAINLYGQSTKGASPIASTSGSGTTGTTRAVVIGISDYADPGIPDLKFAHKDAEAYAEYLRSKAGGGLTDDQLMLLTNEDATTAQMAMALDWLMEKSQDGDKAIIYFSGHGDVETKTKMQNGFLLTYDSPSKVYVAGAYPLFYLQSVISTLSENNVQALVVTDACHAGALAGSNVGGAQATSAVLAKQFSNEVKILSCQPEEFSLEGEQWGGGRGAFSYHFVEGLYGLADNNDDQSVNLLELGRYLEDKVTAEAAPQSQIPMTVGSKATKLAHVDKSLLSQLKAQKDHAAPMLASIESKGIEENVLASTDQQTREQYLAFKTALAKGDLLTPENKSANDLYVKLSNKSSLEQLHSLMRRNLAAALLDEAQRTNNKMLANDPEEMSKAFALGQYRHIPPKLARAAELLGEEHYMYNRIIGQKYFYDALNRLTKTHDLELMANQYRAAIPLAKKGMELYGENALGYCFLQSLYGPINIDSSFYFYKKALQLSPTYAFPHLMIGFMFNNAKRYNLSIKYEKKAIKIDPGYYMSYNNIGCNYSDKKKYQQAESWCKKSIEVFPNAAAYSNLGSLYHRQGHDAEAEAMCLKGIEVEPLRFSSYYKLAELYKDTHQDAKLPALLLKMEELADARLADYSEVALGYLHLKDYHRFRSFYYKANGHSEWLRPSFFYEVSTTYATQGKKEEALNWLQLALERGYDDWKEIRKDKDLDSIRGEARFQELIKEYKKKIKITCEDCLWNDFKKKG